MRTKLFFGALLTGLVLGGSGAVALPASAELRVVTIKLADGRELQTTVDVPPGSPAGDGTPVAETPQPGDPSTPADTPTTDETDDADEGGDPKAEPKPKRPKRKPGGKRKRSKQDDTGGAKDTRDKDNLTLALPGPAPIGVPNFIINKFRIPPFLLPIYQAAGIQYGIRWEILAAINEIETDYGRNLNVSSAGALGWMQFLPSSWKTYGVDANADREKDPYNPVDAIFAAARYLKAAGGHKDIRRAIFAYNHAGWYVDSVLMRARLIAGLPADLVSSITGLTQGHFPVHGKARYANNLRRGDVRKLSRKVRRSHNAAKLVKSDKKRRSINIYGRRQAAVIAVNDGVVKKIGRSDSRGRYVVLQDVYGNRYIYSHLARISKRYPVPKRTGDKGTKSDDFRPARQADLPKPAGPATAGTQSKQSRKASGSSSRSAEKPASARKERLFANPTRRANKTLAEENGQFNRALLGKDGFEVFRKYFAGKRRLKAKDVRLKRLKKGSKVIGGTVLGRIGRIARGPGSGLKPHLNFSIRPAGRGAPRIDPKPILDGWKLLEATAIYRAVGKNPFLNAQGDRPTVGQILLMSKEALARRVLSNRRIKIYRCGRSDIRSGQVDRRVLATLEFLAAWGLKPTVTSLKCGHSYYTKSGSVSDHSSGNAIDIAKINNAPILGNQQAGSVTDLTVRRLLTLQGTMRPTQIISLLDMGEPTLAMANHADHIHIGFRPRYGPNAKLGRQARRLLANNQWDKLVARLGSIRNPVVSLKPSKYSIRVKADPHRSSDAHAGE